MFPCLDDETRRLVLDELTASDGHTLFGTRSPLSTCMASALRVRRSLSTSACPSSRLGSS